MRTRSVRVIEVDPDNLDEAVLTQAGAIIRAGGLVAFPTETVYGLGANALDPVAIARLYVAKGRPQRNPIIVHVPSVQAARSLVSAWPPTADSLAAQFWPGPLTMVLPKDPAVPDIVTAGGPTVAVRIPSQPVALALLVAAGVPIAAPSANRSTNLSPTTAQHVVRGLSGKIDLVLDGGPTSAGIESTVVDLTSSSPRILRPGPIGAQELSEVIGLEVVGPTMENMPNPEEAAMLRSPGLMARHYAPRATLHLAADDGSEVVRKLTEKGKRVGWLTFDGRPTERQEQVQIVVLPKDATAYASRLYAVLHELDEVGVDDIVAAHVPDDPAWLAIRDRLSRAAT
jgi:L-threonylcarbamoyladenylate synthase